MNQEVWKIVKDFPNYEVSNRGNVRNIISGKILKQSIGVRGYKAIHFYRDNKKIQHYIHKLIAMRFIDNPNNCTCVGHIDDNILNNDIQNLRWETNQQQSMMQKKTKRKTTSIYKGVSFNNNRQKWIAIIQIDRKGKYLGAYESEIEAAKAYDIEAKKLFKEFARLNLEEDERNQIEIIKKKSSIYRGVSFCKQSQKWRAYITFDKKKKYLGQFETELEAAKAYDEAAKREYKELAVLNLKEDESNKIEIKQKKENSSIYRGITFHKYANKWQAYIIINKKMKHLGLFETEIEAARAYDKAAKELHKQFAKLNFKDEEELTEQLANLNINEDKQE